MRNAVKVVLLLVALTNCAGPAEAQTFDDWVTQRINAILDEMNADKNSKAPEKQKEAPANVPAATSLVDQSAASDFVSVATSLVPIRSKTGGEQTQPAASAITVSAYSLYAMAKGVSLTDPTFYKDHTAWRQMYFTAGSAKSKAEEDGTEDPAAVVGTKLLLINQRDLYSANGQTQVANVQRVVTGAAGVLASVQSRIQTIIHQDVAREQPFTTFLGQFSDTNFKTLLARLAPATLQRIDDTILESISAFAELNQTIRDAYDAVRKGQQLALSFSANLRPKQGNDDYRAELIYDHGLSDRVIWTMNFSADYKDRKQKEDSRGARAATEFLGALSRPDKLWGNSPTTLSFSAEGKWQQNTKPILTAQIKLSIPITTGIDLPIVYRYANRTTAVDAGSAETRLGLSVDVGRLSGLFR